MQAWRAWRWAATMVVAGACGREGPARVPADGLPATGVLGEIALGDIAGAATGRLRLAASIENPYADDARAIREGEQLFEQMNCVGCHGYGAQGGMCPDLTDASWRYGGLPAQVFNSVYEGRPKGMPAYGRMLPDASIWRIVAYVQSLEGTFARRGVLAERSGSFRRGGAARAMKGRQDAGEK